MQIGRYAVLEELGRGGMGRVYKGRDPNTGREVAIKVLLKGREASPEQRTRFDREARALAKVEHGNVVRLLDVGEDKGAPYLVMAFHPAGSLEDMIRTTLLSPSAAVRLGTQLAAGLEAAHAVGVLHRDLKPGNVLLGLNGSAMLTDFGLAKDLEREGQTQALTKSGLLQGTPGFWAPEQAEGRLDAVGPATDVYGLGATLYAALSGRAPFVGEGLIAILTATANDRPPSLRSLRPEVPRELESVVMRCLEKAPAARWASAAELKQALADCLHAGEAPSSSRRLGLLAVAGVVAVCGGVVIAGVSGAMGAAPKTSPTADTRSADAQADDTQAADTQSADTLYEAGRAAIKAQRLEEAAALYRRAAERGHTGAMGFLGVMLAQGSGVAKDEAQAVEWYRRAAEGGNARAMTNLGRMLARGSGVAKDEAQAVEWYRRAAVKGDVDAMTNLGLMLENGRGVARNEAQAVEWHRRAAEKGDARAMTNLGLAIARGSGVAKDEAQAVEWYRRAAVKGDVDGMISLGFMLENGRGVARNEAQAVEWYRRAAEKGSTTAMTNLGFMLEYGRGVPTNEEQAVEWYRRAAERGDTRAMTNLGVMLENGLGVAKDLEQAVKWYRGAAQSDEPRVRQAARAELKRLGR
ncbi:MAG: SEL1-like repeat protein [Planctomycetes bacterium]|nr:SEL1-like repeat protein [Planctomycetota bacterium]